MTPRPYGVVAEFAEADALLKAIKAAREHGFRKMDAYAPCPVEGLAQALGVRFTGVPFICLCGGLTGGGIAYDMQYFAAVVDYPLNVGGRPLHSWPSFIVITFELTVLFAALSAAFGMLLLNGLPRLHHPIFNTPFFAERNSSRFYLCIEERDPRFEIEATMAFLREQQPLNVWEVAE